MRRSKSTLTLHEVAQACAITRGQSLYWTLRNTRMPSARPDFREMLMTTVSTNAVMLDFLMSDMCLRDMPEYGEVLFHDANGLGSRHTKEASNETHVFLQGLKELAPKDEDSLPEDYQQIYTQFTQGFGSWSTSIVWHSERVGSKFPLFRGIPLFVSYNAMLHGMSATLQGMPPLLLLEVSAYLKECAKDIEVFGVPLGDNIATDGDDPWLLGSMPARYAMLTDEMKHITYIDWCLMKGMSPYIQENSVEMPT